MKRRLDQQFVAATRAEGMHSDGIRIVASDNQLRTVVRNKVNSRLGSQITTQLFTRGAIPDDRIILTYGNNQTVVWAEGGADDPTLMAG